MTVVKQNVNNFTLIHRKKIAYEVKEHVLSRKGEYIHSIDDIDENLCNIAVAQNQLSFNTIVENKNIKQDVIERLVRKIVNEQAPSVLLNDEFFRIINTSYELQRIALQKNGFILKFLDWIETSTDINDKYYELKVIAIKRNGNAIKYIEKNWCNWKNSL